MEKLYSSYDACQEILEIIHKAGYTPFEVDADAYFKATFQLHFSGRSQYWEKRQNIPAPEDYFYGELREAVSLEALTEQAQNFIDHMRGIEGWEEGVAAKDMAEGLYWAGETVKSASVELIQKLYRGES